MTALLKLYVLVLCGIAVLGASKKDDKKKSKTPLKGSQKCEKGVFGSLSKDATVPLCDAHYPDGKGKSDWLVLFYNKESEEVQDIMNRVAVDLGNEPPEKSKQLKKAKKQRTRIKDLAEKYEFEAHIPKKGLEDKGKDPIMKVGAVCCDCAGATQALCGDRDLGIRLVRQGMDEVAMPGGADAAKDAGSIVTFALGGMGFVKGQEDNFRSAEAKKEDSSGKKEESKSSGKKEESKSSGKKDESKSSGKKEDIKVKMTTPEVKKKEADKKPKATDSKDDKKRKKDKPKENKADLEARLKNLEEAKAKAIEQEDYKLAKKVKKDIEDVKTKLEKAEL